MLYDRFLCFVGWIFKCFSDEWVFFLSVLFIPNFYISTIINFGIMMFTFNFVKELTIKKIKT